MSRKAVLLAALLLAFVFACRKPGETVNSGVAGTDTSATAMSGTDTSGTTTTSTAASATTTGSTGGTVSNLSADDKDFVMKIDALSNKSGKDFDKSYRNETVGDHDKTVKLLERKSKIAQDGDAKRHPEPRRRRRISGGDARSPDPSRSAALRMTFTLRLSLLCAI